MVSATQRVFPAIDGIAQPLCHQLLGGVLRQLDKEHTRFCSDVSAVRRVYNKRKKQHNLSSADRKSGQTGINL